MKKQAVGGVWELIEFLEIYRILGCFLQRLLGPGFGFRFRVGASLRFRVFGLGV